MEYDIYFEETASLLIKNQLVFTPGPTEVVGGYFASTSVGAVNTAIFDGIMPFRMSSRMSGRRHNIRKHYY